LEAKLAKIKLIKYLKKGMVAPLEVPCVTCETTFSDPKECDPCLNVKTGKFNMAKLSIIGTVNKSYIEFIKPHLRV
jgi:hypothetical protein